MDFESLNQEQKKAVTLTEGCVRVIAGAGSGKTRALTHRFAYLVNEIGILPGNILCVTFTNKAANEMRQRIHALTGDNDTGFINTFHGFCVSVLQEDSHVVSYPKNFLVLDNSDIDQILRTIYAERGLTLRDMTFSQARDYFEIRKLFLEPRYFLEFVNMSVEDLYAKYMNAKEVRDILFYGYLYYEKKCFGLDYNDLIKVVLYIFEINEEVKLKWQKRLEYIMVDEFQDIDELQYQLMTVLCGYHKNLFIVGDPDQTIYTWRGAKIEYLLGFDKNFQDVRTIYMNRNYRSVPSVLKAVNSLIEKNKHRLPKSLIPMLPEGKSVLYHHAKTQDAEALWIVEQIKKLREEGVPYRDITLLYRAHYVTRVPEEIFLKNEIPYTIYSGVQFFNRAEIKDALSYLRMLAFQDDLSFERIINTPKRNIGERRIKFLKEEAEKSGKSLYMTLIETQDEPIFKGTKAKDFIRLIENFSRNYSERPVSEVLREILEFSGYEEMLRTEGGQERLDNLAELKQAIFDFEVSCGEETGLEDYLRRVALFSNQDKTGSRDEVKMMTVHAAKGLEFPYVFLVGMNEGVFPSRKVKTIDGMEEERRLAFVAMTRAEKRLHLSEAEGKNFDGTYRYPSRFILDIDKDLIEYTVPLDENLLRDAKHYVNARKLYLRGGKEEDFLPIDTRVAHSVFGKGKIIGIDRDNRAYLIKFDEMGTPRTISFKVKLKKLIDQ